MNNNIILAILSSHSLHLTQSLDVDVFDPLKKHLAAKIDLLIRLDVARIQKVKWLTAFVIAQEKAFRIQNILDEFRDTGIHSFESTKVLNRVASSSSSTQIRLSTSSISTISFNDAMFISFLVNFNDVQRANIALNDMIASNNSISILAKKYVPYLIQNLERLQAINIILQCENEQLKTNVHGKKRQLSDKRRVIDGKHIITATKLEEIQEAEKVTRERKEKQSNKVPRKGNLECKKS